MNFTATLLPILAILHSIESTFPPVHSPWTPINYAQETLLHRFYPQKEHLAKLHETEIDTIVSRTVEPVNQFLEEHNFSICLQPEANPVWYAASVLFIRVQWLYKGIKTILAVENQEFQAIRMTKGYTIYSVPHFAYELIKIDTTSGDQVYITCADKARNDVDLLESIAALASQPLYCDITHEYEAIVFPMIDVNQEVDISWLFGMYIPFSETTHEKIWISQAVQQTKFQMNEEGALTQSAAGSTVVTKSMSEKKHSYIIDKPFYLWLVRKGISVPLFAGYMDSVDWKNPGTLCTDTSQVLGGFISHSKSNAFLGDNVS